MQEKLTAIKGAFVALTATLFIYLEAVSVPVLILILLMICDYITGMAVAYINHTLSSRIGIKGIVKKLCYLLAVVASMGIDWVISSVHISFENSYTVAMLVTIWLIINEIVSILENLKKIGIPVPKFLDSIIDRLKISTEEKGNNKNE